MIARRFRVHDPEVNAAAYVTGELAGRSRRRFEDHLVDCEDCWREVRLGRVGRRLVEEARELAPARLREDVRAAVLLSGAPRGGRRWPLLPVAAALVLALAVSGGLFVFRAGREPAPIQAALAAYRSAPSPSSAADRSAPDLSAEGLRLAASGSVSLAGLEVDRFEYRTADDERIVLFLSDEPFPQANGATAHEGAVHGWEAQADGLALVCGERPVSYLLVGEDPSLLERAETELVREGVALG